MPSVRPVKKRITWLNTCEVNIASMRRALQSTEGTLALAVIARAVQDIVDYDAIAKTAGHDKPTAEWHYAKDAIGFLFATDQDSTDIRQHWFGVAEIEIGPVRKRLKNEFPWLANIV